MRASLLALYLEDLVGFLGVKQLSGGLLNTGCHSQTSQFTVKFTISVFVKITISVFLPVYGLSDCGSRYTDLRHGSEFVSSPDSVVEVCPTSSVF